MWPAQPASVEHAPQVWVPALQAGAAGSVQSALTSHSTHVTVPGSQMGVVLGHMTVFVAEHRSHVPPG